MNKILEELKNMEEINSDFKKNLENEKALKGKEKELKEMYENLQLKMIGTEERSEALKEYEDKKNKIEDIRSKKEVCDKDIEEKFEKQKKKIIEEIDKKLEIYEQAKQEKIKNQQEEKERNEKVSQLESRRNAYSKIAQNSRKDIANMLEKINNGERVNMDRLTDAQKEYSANSKKVINIEDEIKELNEKKIEISQDIEINPEEISDLQYLKFRIVGTKISELDKIKEDPFVDKYGKKEIQGMDDNSEKNSKEDSKEKNNSEKEPKEELNGENDNLGKEKTKIENDNFGKNKDENPQNEKIQILLDEYYNKIVINGKKEEALGLYRKEGKSLKEDNELAIGSLFSADKKMLKYIDYGLLKALDSQDRNLALEYLNVVRGGGIKSASESAEILRNAVDIKYKFNNGLGTFLSFRKKRTARKAVELGIAEIEGINDKSIVQRINEMLSKVKNTKLFNIKEKPKALQAKIEEKVEENGLGELKVDNKDNHIEKMAQEKRKHDVEKIINEDAVKVKPNEVEVIPPENNGHEIA